MTDSFLPASPRQMLLGEALVLAIDFTEQAASGGAPSSVTAVYAYDAAGVDKAADVLSGVSAIVGNVVTLPKFTPASAQTYRIAAKVLLAGGSTVYGVEDCRVISVLPTAITISNGYATLQELKDYVLPAGASDPLDDAVIARLIESASRYADSYTGRTFYARTETRYYGVPEGNALAFDDDLLTITTLTNGDGVVIASSEYYFTPRNASPKRALTLHDYSAVAFTASSTTGDSDCISVAGTWGYSASAPADVKEAVLQIANAWYRRRFGENSSGTATVTAAGVVITPQDIPVSARALLNIYKKRI